MKKIYNIGLLFLFAFFQLQVNAQEWTLQECLSYAEEHNQNIIATNQQIIASNFDSKASKAGLIPEINLHGDLNYYWQIPVQVFPGELLGQSGESLPVRMGTPWMSNVGATASWDIINPAKWSDIKLSALQEQLTKENASSFKQMLYKNIRMSFYQIQLLQQNIEISNERIATYQKIHSLLEIKLQNGLIDKIALNQSMSILEDLKNTKTLQEKDNEQTMLSLKFWMGYPLDDTLVLANETLILQHIEGDFDPDKTPGYSEKILELEIAKQHLKSTKSNLYPKLSLIGGYSGLGFGQEFSSITQSQWFASGYVGLQLDIPILSIGKMAYLPKKQKALIASKNADFENFSQQKEQEFLQKRLDVNAKQKIVDSRKNQLALAQENTELSYQKIQNGVIDMIELKQIQQDLNEALIKLNEAELSLWNDIIELEYLQSK